MGACLPFRLASSDLIDALHRALRRRAHHKPQPRYKFARSLPSHEVERKTGEGAKVSSGCVQASIERLASLPPSSAGFSEPIRPRRQPALGLQCGLFHLCHLTINSM